MKEAELLPKVKNSNCQNVACLRNGENPTLKSNVGILISIAGLAEFQRKARFKERTDIIFLFLQQLGVVLIKTEIR